MIVHACAWIYAFICNHDVYIVRFYVFIHVSMRMYVFIPIVCCVFKTGVSETCRFILKVYLFVFALFLDKQV